MSSNQLYFILDIQDIFFSKLLYVFRIIIKHEMSSQNEDGSIGLKLFVLPILNLKSNTTIVNGYPLIN